MGGDNLYDVAVIGGGPAGSRVAYQLAGMGYGVVVLDKKERLEEPVCCTGIIGRECASTFAIDDGVILRWANSARIFSPSGKLVRVWREQPQACVVDRSAFNLTMAERAVSRGAEYRLNSRVTDVKILDQQVDIELYSQGNKPDVLVSRVVVVAAGAGSRLVDRMGLGKVGDIVTGAQAEVQVQELEELEVYTGQQVAPDFFAWLVPISTQKALVGLMSRQQPGQYLSKLMSFLVTEGKIVSDEATIRYGGVPLKPLKRTYGDRLIVVGGAAGQAKPITGGGIYYGLLCADIAADVLHRALTNNALSARNLAGYERKWKKRLGQEIRLGYWARRFYELLSDSQIDRIVNIITSRGIDKALLEADDLSFDWHGSVVLRLLGHQALSSVIKAARIPLPVNRRKKESNNVGT